LADVFVTIKRVATKQSRIRFILVSGADLNGSYLTLITETSEGVACISCVLLTRLVLWDESWIFSAQPLRLSGWIRDCPMFTAEAQRTQRLRREEISSLFEVSMMSFDRPVHHHIFNSSSRANIFSFIDHLSSTHVDELRNHGD
jgi:hypothetical protein